MMGRSGRFFNFTPFGKEFMDQLIGLLMVGKISIEANEDEEGGVYVFITSYGDFFSIEEIDFIVEKFKEADKIDVFGSIDLEEGEGGEMGVEERVVISVYYSPETLEKVLSPETIELLRSLR